MNRYVATVIIGLSAIFFNSTSIASNLKDCREDVERLCKGVKLGEGRIRQCLIQNRSKLSIGCKAELFDKMMEKKER